jgi:hypothetical protein
MAFKLDAKGLNILFEFLLCAFHSFRERKILNIFETINCVAPIILTLLL